MKQDVSKILEKQLLLMKYNPANNLSENIKKIITIPILFEQGSADRYTDYINSPQGQRQLEIEKNEEMAKEYPNYCPYKEYAVLPGKNSVGLEGKDALIDGFCMYRGVGGGIFLPLGVKSISFWDIDSINYAVEKWMIKHPEENKNIVIENLGSVLKVGSVSSFEIIDGEYKTHIQRQEYPAKGPWAFSGYKNTKTGHIYKNPEYVDPRTEYQKFVDEWALTILIVGSLALAFFTGGASVWALWVETFFSLGMGGIIAWRDFEKGNYVGAALGMLFMALPIAKLTSRYFRGWTDDEFFGLANKLSKSNLTSNSSVADYIKFYNKLSPRYQQLMTKALKYDNKTWNGIISEINAYGKANKAVFLNNAFKNLVKNQPEIFKSISFWQTPYINEIFYGLDLMAMYQIVESYWGDDLNDKAKENLTKIQLVVPPELMKEIIFNIMMAGSKGNDIISSPEMTNAINFIEDRTKMAAENAVKYLNDTTKTVFNNNGIEYQEIPSEPTIGYEITTIDSLSADDEKKYRDMGWKPYSEIPLGEIPDYENKDYMEINKRPWLRIHK